MSVRVVADVYHEPLKVEETTLYVDRPFENTSLNIKYTITHLHICTRSGFMAFGPLADDVAWVWRRPDADADGYAETVPASRGDGESGDGAWRAK
jgi:hypothetical protein